MTIKMLTDMMVHVLVPSLTLIYSSDTEVDRQRLVDEETRALKSPKVPLCVRVGGWVGGGGGGGGGGPPQVYGWCLPTTG